MGEKSGIDDFFRNVEAQKRQEEERQRQRAFQARCDEEARWAHFRRLMQQWTPLITQYLAALGRRWFGETREITRKTTEKAGLFRTREVSSTRVVGAYSIKTYLPDKPCPDLEGQFVLLGGAPSVTRRYRGEYSAYSSGGDYDWEWKGIRLIVEDRKGELYISRGGGQDPVALSEDALQTILADAFGAGPYVVERSRRYESEE